MKRAKNVNIRGDFMIFGQKEAYLKKKGTGISDNLKSKCN